MSIVRAARKDQFYTLPTATIDDDRLSWEARGLLIYLLSKPDHWQVQVRDLINRTRNAIGKSSGRDKVYSILKELRAAGYVYRQHRRTGGNFAGIEYEVSEHPDLEQSAAFLSGDIERETPFTDFPDTVTPVTAKPETLDKTERATKIEKAVKNLASSNECGFEDTAPPEMTGCPANYPGHPDATNTAPWRAYAIAFKARYKNWPIYNATIAGQLSKVIQRVGDETPMTARYFVEHVHQTQIVDNCHPISSLLRYCESYVVKARKAEKARQRAAETFKRAEASASTPEIQIVAPMRGQLAAVVSTAPAITQVAKESRALLAGMLGGPLAQRMKVESQSQEG